MELGCQNVAIIGDTGACGHGGPVGLALRLSRPGLLAHDLTTPGAGMSGALRRVVDLRRFGDDYPLSAVIVAVGIDDARENGARLEVWASAFRALVQGVQDAGRPRRVFLIPPHPVIKEAALPAGYNSDARRWVRRATVVVQEVAQELGADGRVVYVGHRLEPEHYENAVALRPAGYDVIASDLLALLTEVPGARAQSAVDASQVLDVLPDVPSSSGEVERDTQSEADIEVRPRRRT